MSFLTIILHTNDIHGRLEGLARIATLVERIRAENLAATVLYFDLGDSEGASEHERLINRGLIE